MVSIVFKEKIVSKYCKVSRNSYFCIVKNLLFLFLATTLFSCRQDESGIQKIDQILSVYIEKDNVDMLNSSLPQAYTRLSYNDVYGLLDNSPVNIPNKIDANGIHYLEYLAGAVRRRVDSSETTKTYESKIALALTTKVNDSVNTIENDTMIIRYLSTPEIFQISEVFYNGSLEFTKTPGAANVVKLKK